MLEDIFSLANKNALITGAAGLLGMKHAEAILIAGGTPVLADLEEGRLNDLCQTLQYKWGQKPIPLPMDVTDEISVQTALGNLNKKKIPIDILINNAARNPKVGAQMGVECSNRLEALDLASFQKDLDVSLKGAVLCAKYFGTEMAKRGSGVILNVASDLAVIAPDQRLYKVAGKPDHLQDVKPISYSVAKHGVIGLTKYLATYWADRGVRCNALSPGGVYAGQPEEFVRRISELIPLGRMAKADEYQGAIIFMCSAASSYLNGANLTMDGGRSVW